MSEIKHGLSAYNSGRCRCPVCRAAKATYQRQWGTRQGGIVPPQVGHGTKSAYQNYGCRCDSCRAAHSAYFRDYRQRRRQSA